MEGEGKDVFESVGGWIRVWKEVMMVLTHVYREGYYIRIIL